MGAGDRLLPHHLELKAEEDDLFGENPLDVADKLDRIERDLGQELVNELVRLHASTVVAQMARRRDICAITDRPSLLGNSRQGVPFLVGCFQFGATAILGEGNAAMPDITVDKRACTRCGACVDVCCIATVFELDETGLTAARPEACWNCGHCVAVCPEDAIDHDSFPLGDCPIIDRDSLPTDEQLTGAFRARRSVRSFQERVIPREIVREVVSASRWAPTAENSQAFDWIAFDDRARIGDLVAKTMGEMVRVVRTASHPLARPFIRVKLGRRMTKRLLESRAKAALLVAKHAQGEDPIFYKAPVVLIGHVPSGSAFGRDDAIYATYNAMLAAERHGLGTCQIGLFQIIVERSPALRRMIGLPKGRDPQVAVTLGYPKAEFRRMVPRRSPNLSWNPR